MTILLFNPPVENKQKNNYRKNPYDKLVIPKKVRKPELFKAAAKHILDTLVAGGGETVDFTTKNKCNKRYADIIISLLRRKHLITITPGYRFSRKDWSYRKLTPSLSFSNALHLLRPEATELPATSSEFIDNLNKFYSQQVWRGCAQPVVYQHLEHGRIYATGPNRYQSFPARRRSKITVNGQKLVELDISGSHLQALLGLHRSGKDECDPYSLHTSVDRKEIKGAFKMLLGSTAKSCAKPAASWYQDADYRSGKVTYSGSCKAATAALLRAYPFLNLLQQGTCYDLMRAEANIIVNVIKTLMKKGIPSLSMHDGLLVPEKAEEYAKTLLKREYESEFEIIPLIKVKKYEDVDVSDEETVENLDVNDIFEEIMQYVGIESETLSAEGEFKDVGAGQPATLLKVPKTDKVSRGPNGGARPGAGRPKGNREWITLNIPRSTYFRMKKKGIL